MSGGLTLLPVPVEAVLVNNQYHQGGHDGDAGEDDVGIAQVAAGDVGNRTVHYEGERRNGTLDGEDHGVDLAEALAAVDGSHQRGGKVGGAAVYMPVHSRNMSKQ